jgi:AcrR family transcriptional regulator
MSYSEFKKMVDLSKAELCREVFARHPGAFRVKKEATVVRNLERIFAAALRIANQKGFAAMTMRDLSAETGMSMGALYAYFPAKEDLLAMLQDQRRSVTRRILEQRLAQASDPLERLRCAVRTHLYLSEAMQPWFFFAYMEARRLPPAERRRTLEGELATERLFEDLLRQAAEAGAIAARDFRLGASLLKAMLQDWYLKHWKHAGRKITVDQYAAAVLDQIEHYRPGPGQNG